MVVGKAPVWHVALVLPPFGRLSSAGEGHVERIAATLARGLVEEGHRVTLFSTGDSQIPGAHTEFLFREALWPPEPLAEWNHAVFAATTLAGLDVDLVHSFCPAFVALAGTVHAPVVHTITHGIDPAATRLYASHPNVRFVCLSAHQAIHEAERLSRAPRVVHPGLDAERYPFGSGADRDALFLGRLDAERAPHLALRVARAADLPLRIAGADSAGDYFEKLLAPELERGGGSLLGELSGERRAQALGSAGVFVSTLDPRSPWDLAAVEAMLCGTPVVALRHGSSPEVVDDGLTGLLADDLGGLVVKAQEALLLDRRLVRERALERFGAHDMVRKYIGAYEEASLERSPWPVSAVP